MQSKQCQSLEPLIHKLKGNGSRFTLITSRLLYKAIIVRIRFDDLALLLGASIIAWF
jgi:hypothetical protein